MGLIEKGQGSDLGGAYSRGGGLIRGGGGAYSRKYGIYINDFLGCAKIRGAKIKGAKI